MAYYTLYLVKLIVRNCVVASDFQFNRGNRGVRDFFE